MLRPSAARKPPHSSRPTLLPLAAHRGSGDLVDGLARVAVALGDDVPDLGGGGFVLCGLSLEHLRERGARLVWAHGAREVRHVAQQHADVLERACIVGRFLREHPNQVLHGAAQLCVQREQTRAKVHASTWRLLKELLDAQRGQARLGLEVRKGAQQQNKEA